MVGACRDWQELLCLAILAYLGPRRALQVGCAGVTSISSREPFASARRAGKVSVKPMPFELLEILRAAVESTEVACGADETT